MVKKKKKFVINIKNMGVNIDKNEYREIVLSNSNRPDIIKNKEKKGFTLAEVILALVAVEIVFILIIPSLVKNYLQNSYATAFMKSLNALNDAIRLTTAIEGETPLNSSSLFNYLQGHMIITTKGKTDWKAKVKLQNGEYEYRNLAFYTLDGARFEFPTQGTNPVKLYETGVEFSEAPKKDGPSNCGYFGTEKYVSGEPKNYPCIIVVDVNGDKPPSPYFSKDKKTEKNKDDSLPVGLYQLTLSEKEDFSDIYTILITDKEAIPYGAVAQKIMYGGK